MSDYDTLVEGVSAIAEQMRGLQAVAMAQYTPVVETIIATHSHDVRQIEQTLDGLLGRTSSSNLSSSLPPLFRHRPRRQQEMKSDA